MKTFYYSLLLAVPVCVSAQTVAPAPDAPATPPQTVVVAPVSPLPAPISEESSNAFLNARGEITLETLLRDGGLSDLALSPEAREQLGRAVEERNSVLRRANARLAEEMRRAFKATDAQLAQSVEDEQERRKLERIRQFQPKRYQAIMRARAKKKSAPR